MFPPLLPATLDFVCLEANIQNGQPHRWLGGKCCKTLVHDSRRYLPLITCTLVYADVDDRLLLSVRKPAVVNSTFESLTIGMLL